MQGHSQDSTHVCVVNAPHSSAASSTRSKPIYQTLLSLSLSDFPTGSACGVSGDKTSDIPTHDGRLGTQTE